MKAFDLLQSEKISQREGQRWMNKHIKLEKRQKPLQGGNSVFVEE